MDGLYLNTVHTHTCAREDCKYVALQLRAPDREANPDLPIFGSLNHCESSSLDHAATDEDGWLLTGSSKFERTLSVPSGIKPGSSIPEHQRVVKQGRPTLAATACYKWKVLSVFILALSRRGQERMRAYHIPSLISCQNRAGIQRIIQVKLPKELCAWVGGWVGVCGGVSKVLKELKDAGKSLTLGSRLYARYTLLRPTIAKDLRLSREYETQGRPHPSSHDEQADDPRVSTVPEIVPLTCVLCESEVRSETVWSVHINGKQHRDNIARVKRRKEELTKQELLTTAKPTLSLGVKRSAPREIQAPPKKIKSILKNANEPPRVPVGFFDVMNGPTAANNTKNITIEPVASAIEKKDSVTDVSTLVELLGSNSEESEDSESEKVSENGAKDLKIKNTNPEEPLPEGFFDDPMLDAKARHVEYKDPIQEEWDKFQREMKEEVTVSAQIIAEDQEEATAERQIDEIDEQIRNWNRVLDLERKKEEVTQAGCTRSGSLDDADDVSSPDEADFDEYLDWRAKKSYK
uniref:Zinc finger protein 830 n=1 Tax=Timema bartmani TaxID=61472 RepID=A0A7R9HV46_9NEOP|nr:unnamed protein product [Timema bartmani]